MLKYSANTRLFRNGFVIVWISPVKSFLWDVYRYVCTVDAVKYKSLLI